MPLRVPLRGRARLEGPLKGSIGVLGSGFRVPLLWDVGLRALGFPY